MKSSRPDLSRREFALTAAALPVRAAERYRLGCMSGIFSSLPLEDAVARIRKAGYRYIAPAPKHAGVDVFTPETPAAERARTRQRFKDLGVEPFLSLGGFGAELYTPKGLDQCRAQLDLCAEFGIPVMVGAGPWYYKRFPNLPKRDVEWREEVARFYAALEKAVRHAESVRVTFALKPHTGITANAKACMEVVKRIVSERLQICWDAGNVSFYEGIHPDPDLPDLAPHVKAVCLKDHLGLRGDPNFPPPGQGQIDHEQMFRTLFSAGFNGPLSVERVDGRDTKAKLVPEVAGERLAAAFKHLTAVLDRVTAPAA